MVVTQHRRTGRFLLLIGTLAWAVACVSGGSEGGTNDGPECYSNSDCPGGHECSKGVCVGYVGCGSGCRTNETCLDGVCRLQCSSNADCEDEGLICGSDTAHCKPGQNPTRPQSQPQSGSGGTGSTGAGGSPGTGGAAHGGALNAASAGGMPGVGGSAPAAAGQASGVAGSTAAFAAAGSSSVAGHAGF